MAKGIQGSKEVRWKWVVGNGGQGAGHDGMRGEGAWLRNTEDEETRMGNGWAGGRRVECRVRGGAQAGCWAECRVGCGAKRGAGGEGGVRWEEAKNGVRNHFGRHFTNIVYIIKKMF